MLTNLKGFNWEKYISYIPYLKGKYIYPMYQPHPIFNEEQKYSIYPLKSSILQHYVKTMSVEERLEESEISVEESLLEESEISVEDIIMYQLSFYIEN